MVALRGMYVQDYDRVSQSNTVRSIRCISPVTIVCINKVIVMVSVVMPVQNTEYGCRWKVSVECPYGAASHAQTERTLRVAHTLYTFF